MMEYGFVSLCDKNDKVYGLLKESNNIDYLGLRKMNVRLSNLMFPFANTLMPNLVYFYYLHAIYYAVLSKGENKTIDREPTVDEIKEINELEKIISAFIRNLTVAKGKGFFGDVKVRAYGKYKNSMKLMHFFDSEWIPTFGTDKQRGEWNTKHENKTLHMYLKDTERFKFVQELVKISGNDKEKKLTEKKDSGWLYKLDDIEKRDFIWRVIDPYGPELGTITKHSVFSNIVMYYCEIKNKPGLVNSKIYKNDSIKIDNSNKFVVENLYFSKKEIDKRANTPELKAHCEKNKSGCKYISIDNKEYKPGLKDILEAAKINGGTDGNTYSKVNQLRVFEVAEEYSKLQLIAKLAYNMCLFEKNVEEQNKYKNMLKKEMEEYKENYEKSNIDGNNNNDYARVFFNENDPLLRGAFSFIQDVSKCVRSSDDEYKIKIIVGLVKEREIEVLGGNSRLDSGMAFDAMGDFEDTFRWEYRPEIKILEAEESEDKDSIDDLNGDHARESNDDDNNNLHNMCARYYIYELFFEK